MAGMSYFVWHLDLFYTFGICGHESVHRGVLSVFPGTTFGCTAQENIGTPLYRSMRLWVGGLEPKRGESRWFT